MWDHILRLIKALLKSLWDKLLKQFGEHLKRWALYAVCIGFVGFVGLVLIIWILVAGI